MCAPLARVRMSPAAWAELIASYVSGRLSADSFKRRFEEAFTIAVEQRLRVPAGIQALAYVVQAYAGDPMARGHDVADDADMMRAARAALAELAPAQIDAPQDQVIIESIDPEAMRGQARRMAFTVGAFGLAGCALALCYVGIGVLQLFAVADQIQRVTDLGPVVATLGGLALAFIPIIGGTIAYFGATDGWGWPNLVAGLVFFAFPVAILTLGFLRRRTFFPRSAR